MRLPSVEGALSRALTGIALGVLAIGLVAGIALQARRPRTPTRVAQAFCDRLGRGDIAGAFRLLDRESRTILEQDSYLAPTTDMMRQAGPAQDFWAQRDAEFPEGLRVTFRSGPESGAAEGALFVKQEEGRWRVCLGREGAYALRFRSLQEWLLGPMTQAYQKRDWKALYAVLTPRYRRELLGPDPSAAKFAKLMGATETTMGTFYLIDPLWNQVTKLPDGVASDVRIFYYRGTGRNRLRTHIVCHVSFVQPGGNWLVDAAEERYRLPEFAFQGSKPATRPASPTG